MRIAAIILKGFAAATALSAAFVTFIGIWPSNVQESGGASFLIVALSVVVGAGLTIALVTLSKKLQRISHGYSSTATGRTSEMSATPSWTNMQNQPTPVPWIGGYAWSQRNGLRYGVLGTYNARVKDGVGTIGDDVVTLAINENERAAAPRLLIDSTLPIPNENSATDRHALLATPDVAAFWNGVQWPVCCSRLAVLVIVNPTQPELQQIEATVGTLDDASLGDKNRTVWREALAAVRAAEESHIGVNLFHCRHCGGLYGLPSHS